MNREAIAKTCREVIYECVPELEGTPIYEDTVINTDTGAVEDIFYDAALAGNG